jgi:threonyl-tRNA synthetase
MPKQSQDQLSNIRHSLAHLLASSVLEMFPKAKLGVGPVIENGFYYDFLLPRAVTPEELNKLEKRMRDLARQKLSFEAEELKTGLIKLLTFNRSAVFNPGNNRRIKNIITIPTKQRTKNMFVFHYYNNSTFIIKIKKDNSIKETHICDGFQKVFVRFLPTDDFIIVGLTSNTNANLQQSESPIKATQIFYQFHKFLYKKQ